MKMKKTAAFLLALAAAASMVTMPVSAVQFIGGDLDGDGSVTALDAVWILQYAAYVGAGGKQDITEFVLNAEPDKEDAPLPDGAVMIESATGNTFNELLEKGYSFYGYSKAPDKIQLYMSANEIVGEDEQKFIDTITSQTVAELKTNYDFSFNYSQLGDTYQFNVTFGNIFILCDLEHGPEAAKTHSREELINAPQIQGDTIKNIDVSFWPYMLELDYESTQKLRELDKISQNAVKKLGDELIVKRMYFNTKKK